MVGNRLGILVLVALVASCPAQLGAGIGIVRHRRSGNGFDSAAPCPGATVTVTNTGTNAQRVSRDRQRKDGSRSPTCRPRPTPFACELSGFQAAELKDVTLRNGEIVAAQRSRSVWRTSPRTSRSAASRRSCRRATPR